MGICPQLRRNKAQEVTESSWAEKGSHGRCGLKKVLKVEQVFQEVELGVGGDGSGEYSIRGNSILSKIKCQMGMEKEQERQ